MSESSADPPPAIDHTGPATDASARTPSDPAQLVKNDQEPQFALPAASPTSQAKKPPPHRAADIARAVALGEKRSAQERARREERTQKKESLLGLSEAAVRAGAEKKQRARDERIAFRTETLKRRRELEADKRKKEEEEKRKQELERIRAAEKKKQEMYMTDIRTTAEAKIAIQQHLNALTADYATDRQHAEFDHRTAMEQAQRKHAERCREIEKEAHERKNAIESELKANLYRLEGWHRMQLQTQNTETARQLSALKSMRDLRAAERKADEIRQDAYRRQRKLDSDWKDRRKAMEQESAFKQTGAVNEAKEAKNRTESELRAAIHLADSALRHRMEELDTTFKLQKRRLRVAT